MLRWFILHVFFVLQLVLGCTALEAQIRINEIYYDHTGRDDGYEFVELINLAPSRMSLAGFVLEFHDGSSDDWRTLWASVTGDSIGASGLFVLGGHFVSPQPDGTLAFALQNGPDAVRLLENGVAVDLVGYGDLEDPAFFETATSPDTPEGLALGRYPDGVDTDHNARDFRILSPTPGRFNQPRQDVSIALLPGTQSRRAFDAPRAEHIEVRITNVGVRSVAANAVQVALVDSSALGTHEILTVPVVSALNAGDSADIGLDVGVSAAPYRTLTVTAQFGLDERMDNNRVILWRRYETPRLVISEVLSHPQAGCVEFVELCNSGSVPVDVGGYRLRDIANPFVLFETSAIIPSREYIVVTEDRESFLKCYRDVDPTIVLGAGDWPTLNHSGVGAITDSVFLHDAFLLPVDRVGYPGQASDTQGRSVERVDLFSGERDHAWVLSAAIGGTPGRATQPAVLRPPPKRSVELSANPFDPFQGEQLLITIAARGSPSRAHVRVFTTAGRSVKDIGVTAQLPFVFVWDGRDDDGRLVTPGMFILVCEFAGDGGGRDAEKIVLGCGRRGR